MDDSELRHLFLEFAGVATFRNFAQALRRFADDDPASMRLRFWQEQLWLKLIDRHRSLPSEIDRIATALLWCDVHSRPLEKLPSVDLSDVRKTSALQDFCSTNAPFGFGSWTVSCLQCVQQLTNWIAKHPNDCRVLRRRTTLEEYIANCPCHDDPKFRTAIMNAQLAMEGAIKEGDEIWEWDAGDGDSGLAIVRDGKMTTAWRAPIEW